MPKSLFAHEQPITRIFSSDYLFNIPGYQRPYAWTTEQAGDLFDDLVAFTEASQGPVEEMPPYFLGSIVLIKPDGLPNADVVDGQQRLTTLTLLLSAIRANVSPAPAADLTALIYEKGNQIQGTPDRFRLSLRARDREFFERYVQREAGFAELLILNDQSSESHQNIRKNAKLFDERLKAQTEEQRLQLAKFVVTRCFLVVVATPDLDSAYRIFSVLNSRGLDLSPTDILKAEIIGRLSQDRREHYTQKWEDIEEDLGRDAFGDLFSHIRMVYRKAKPQGTLLAEFREHIAKGRSPTQLIDDILIPMAAVYEELTDAAYSSTERAEGVNDYLRWLNRLEFNDWLPPALAFAVRWRNQPANMEAFFRDLERLAYSMLITKAGINERISRFSSLTKEIEEGGDLSAETSALQITRHQQYEMYSVLAGPIYRTLAARARSALLVRLDALMSGGGASYDYATITVEHVLPQNPITGSQWFQWFPDDNVRASLVHKIGNLALLTRKKNSSARNYDFERKKSAYFARGGISPFVLTTQVLQNSKWTPEIVSKRQDELLKRLETHWRLENRKDMLEDILSGDF